MATESAVSTVKISFWLVEISFEIYNNCLVFLIAEKFQDLFVN